MTRAQKELRLFKPPDRTTQMGAIRREDRELIALDSFDPAGDSGRLSVGLPAVWVFVHR
jgi:hypothetical protein